MAVADAAGHSCEAARLDVRTGSAGPCGTAADRYLEAVSTRQVTRYALADIDGTAAAAAVTGIAKGADRCAETACRSVAVGLLVETPAAAADGEKALRVRHTAARLLKAGHGKSRSCLVVHAWAVAADEAEDDIH